MSRYAFVLVTLLFPAPALAQGLTSAPARPDDVSSLDEIVAAFYDVISVAPGQAVDWGRDSTLYLDGVRFTIVGGAESGWTANRVDHATYAADSDAFLSGGFFEREIHRETHRFGPIAQVFSTYEWGRTPGGPPGGRGINGMQLFHDGARWWIVGVTWTAETPETPIPERFLPPDGEAPAGARGDTLGLDDVRAVVAIPWHDLSPDGERIVYLFDAPGGGGPELRLGPSGGGDFRPIATGMSVRSPIGWSPSGATIAFIADGGESNDARTLRVWTVAPGARPQPSCALPGSARSAAWAGPTRISFAAPVDGAPTGESASPARVSTETPPGEAVFICDLASGNVERVTNETYHGLELDWSPSGDRLALSSQREPGFYGALETDLYLVDPATGDGRPLVARPGIDRSPRWSPDGERIAFVTGFGESGLLPNLGVAVASVEDGRLLDIGADHDRGGVFEGPTLVGWSADSEHIHYSVVDGIRVPLFRLSVSGGAPERMSAAWEEGGSPYAYDVSADAETVAFKRSSTGRPAELFAARGGGPANALTTHNQPLARLGVPDAEVIRWTAPDGTEVEGLLMRPLEGRGTAPYPLVTVLHGGPASAFVSGFPGLAFFNPYQDMLLAARGYAVFLPNPRGSGGYGRDFREAARGDWGDGPGADVLSGIDHLVETGVADPGRLALAGWSYGGYLAAWILTRTDRFAVASVGAGVVDLAAHHGQSAPQMDEYFGGPPWARPDVYAEQSPMTWVDRITTPTIIFHGADDTSVSPSQAEQLHTALTSLDVPTALVRYPGEGHSLRAPEAQDDAWQRFFTWLVRWLPEAAGGN